MTDRKLPQSPRTRGAQKSPRTRGAEKSEVPAAFDAGRRPTTAWWARTPGTTATYRCRLIGACRCPTSARVCAFSTPVAAPVHPPRRCCPPPRTPSRRGRRVVGHAGRGRRQALALDGAIGAQPHRGDRRRAPSTGHSTASSPRTCCATSRIPMPNCGVFRNAVEAGRNAGGARVLGSRLPAGNCHVERRLLRRSLSRWPGDAAGDAGLYRYLRRSVNDLRRCRRFPKPAAGTTASPLCTARPFPAGS